MQLYCIVAHAMLTVCNMRVMVLLHYMACISLISGEEKGKGFAIGHQSWTLCEHKHTYFLIFAH